MNTTVRIKASQINKDWHVLDAANVPLGRIATQAATLLRGKHKPTFEPHLDCGDFVIIVNAKQVRVSGTKGTSKLYYRHSGYPGGLRSRTLDEEMTRFPDRVIRQAVWGMLPKGPLGKAILNHLKVYAGPDHPHTSQVVGSERSRDQRDDAIAWTPPRLRILRSTEENGGDVALEEPEASVAEAEAEAEVEVATTADDTGAETAAPSTRRAPRRASRRAQSDQDTED